MYRKLLFSLCILLVTAYSYGQLSENFEGTFPPTDWTLESGSGDWDKSNQTSDHTSGSGYYARYNCYNISGTTPAGLITPTLNVTASDKSFAFWANYYLISGTYGSDSELYVDVSADGGSNWTTGTTNYVSGKQGDGWFLTSIDLGDYESQNFVGSTVIIRFSGVSDYGSYNIGIDDVTGPEIYVPACQTPTTLVESSITSASVDLEWTEIGTATSWDIEYGATPYTFTGTPTITGTSANPYSLTGLSPNTEYTWKVRTDCGGDGASEWSSSNTFSTICASESIPWSQGFEGMTSVGSGIVPACMAETGDWVTKNSSDTYNRVAHSGDNYIYTNWTADDWLFSPALDLVGGTSYDFSFWYITDGNSGWTTVEAKYGTAQTSSDMTLSIGTPVLNPTNTTYVEYRGTFTPPTTGSYNVSIHVIATSNPWYISIDDLTVEETPSCPSPFDLVTSNITKTTATLAWTAGDTETAWEYSYGAEGYGPPTGSGTATTTPTVDISGLNPNQSYDWYVRANCGTDMSTWVGPASFNTLCGEVTAFPYEQGFENGGDMPDCWTQVYETGTADWVFTNGGQSSHPNGAYMGDYNALLYSSTRGSSTWLVSPAMDLSSATSPILEFWHAQTEWYGDQDELSVYYKTSATGDWTLIPGAEWTENISDWTKAGFFLPEPSAEYYIGFKATSDYGYGVVIDQVKITAVPPIPISNWAVLLGIFLMSAVLFFRFKR